MASLTSLWCWKLQNFLFECEDPRVLVKSKWSCKAYVFLGYRLITAIYLLSMSLWIAATSYKFWIYITYWNYILNTLAYVVMAIVAVLYYNWLLDETNSEGETIPLRLAQSEKSTGYNTPLLLQMSWILATCSSAASLCNIYMYWIFVAPTISEFFYIDYATHGPTGVLSLLDIVACARPTQMEHFYVPLCYSFIYYAFTAFYWIGGGLNKDGIKALYEGFGWENLGMALPMIFLHLGTIFCGHVIGCSVAIGRDYVWQAIHTKPSHKNASVIADS